MVSIKEGVKASVGKLKEFISDSKKVALFYDDDPDGICSGVLFEKFLNSQRKSVVTRLFYDKTKPPFSEIFLEKIKDVDLLVFTDYSLSGFGYYEELKKFVEGHDTKVLIIDHHKCEEDYNFSEKLLSINADHIQDEIISAQYCTSKLVYDLIKEVDPSSLTGSAWICAVGIIGDHCMGTWDEFLKKLIYSTNAEFEDETELINPREDDDYYLTPFGKVSNMVFYGAAKGSEEIPKLFEKMISCKNVFEASKMFSEYDSVRKEVYDYLENYDYFIKYGTSDISPLSVFEVEVKSTNNIEVILANMISSKNKELIFFVYKEGGDWVHISARLQSAAIDLGKLFNSVASNFEGANGGGHGAAAGALVPKDIFREFRDTFYYELRGLQDGLL